MAEADVKVQLKADILGFIRDMKIAERALKSFGNQARTTALSSGADKMQKDFGKSSVKIKKHFDQMDKAIQKTGQLLSKGLMFAIKATMLQMAAMGVVMLGIHASFAVGRGLMKAYGGAMKIVAQGGAAIAVALATAAAAMREQQAAMFAYKGSGAKQLGNGINQTRAAMRALAADANLAVIGTEGLNKAYAAMSKSMSSSQIAGSRGMFKALMDFGSAGQDPTAGAEKVAVLINVLNDAKKTIGDVQKAAKELSPEMEKAFKESGIKTKKQFKEMLMSGDLAKKGGVFGQFDAVNGTLINQAKSFFTQIKVQFEQFGDKFLNPAKKAFFEIKNIIRRDLMKLYAELDVVGTGGLFTGIVSVVEKISGLFVKLIRNWLPQAQGQFEKMGNWMQTFKRGWDLVLDKLRPLIKGAKVLESVFSPIWKTLKEQGVAAMENFNENLQANAPYFKELGERIAGLLKSFMKFGSAFRQVFFSALPFINDVLAGVKSVFDALTGVIGRISKSLGGAGLLGLMMISRQMKNTKGGFAAYGSSANQNVQTMNVTQMNVGGQPVGNGLNSGAARGRSVLANANYMLGGPVNTAATPTSGASLSEEAVNDFLKLQEAGKKLKKETSKIQAPVGYSRGEKALKEPGYGKVAESFLNKQTVIQQKEQQLKSLQNPNLTGYAGLFPTTMGKQLMSPQARADINAMRKDFDANPLQTTNIFGDKTKKGMGGLTSMFSKFDAKGTIKDAAQKSKAKNYAYYNTKAKNAITGEESQALTAAELKAEGNKSARLRMRAYRESAGYARIFGNEKLGIRGVNQSVGAKMAGGMGLSIASQFAPEEMRGSLALGSMIGQFNPLAGAAIGFGGAALKSKSPRSGAVAGAAAGAAIGSIFPGIGTGIGAGVGLMMGGIMGAANRAKEQAKKARETVVNALDGLTQAIAAERFSKMEQNAKDIAEGKTVENVGAFEGFATSKSKDMMSVVGKNKSSIKGKSLFEQGATRLVDQLMVGQATRLLSEIPGLASIDKPVEFVKGLFGGNKRKKQQKESVKRIVDYMQSSGANLSESQIKDMNKNRGETIKQFEKTAEAETQAATMLDDTYKTRLDSLEKISGKSRPELELLAKEMGVDLYDSTVKFKDVLGQMGLAMVKTSTQMRQAFTDVYVKGFDTFSQYIKQAEAASSYNEIGENYRALVAEGGSTDLDFAKFMQDLGGAALDRVGGNSLKAFYDISGQMGYEGRQGTAYAAGGIFAGQTLTPAQEKLKNAALGEQEKGLASVAAQQLADIYANKGATVDKKTLEKQLLNMSPDQQQKLFTQLQNGEFDAFGGSQNTGMNFGAKGVTPMLSAGLSAFGLDPSKLSIKELPGEKLDAVATAMTTATEAFKTAVESFTSKTGAIFQAISTPEWLKNVNGGLFSGQAVPVTGADTSAPKGSAVGDTTSSRLGQTMARHSAIDGALSGKRTVTSGYRNWGLGSLGSDHLTGRAVDVVGDNLVSYRDAVKRNGGFAEFHGNGASRHVHAVPGAIGDGRAPASYQPARSGSSTSGGGMSVTVNINGANSSPEEIANRVMAKIKDAERARRERS